MKVSIDIKRDGVFASPMRVVNEMYKHGMSEMGWFWHVNFHPEHYTNRATRKYGYQLRHGERGTPESRRFSKTYTGKKLREKNHTKPLVWEGVSRDESLGSETIEVKAQQNPRVEIAVSNKFNFPSTQWKQTTRRMIDEVGATTPEEYVLMGEVLESESEESFPSINSKYAKTKTYKA